MVKRITFLLIIFVLAFSQSALAATGFTKQMNEKRGETDQNLEDSADPDEDVRVVVEMDGDAPIEKATQRGIMFKQMPKSEQQQLQQKASAQQQQVKDDIEKEQIETDYHEAFNTVVNGFSAELKQKDVDDVEKLAGVKNVHPVNEYERPEEAPDMKYSKELVEAQEAWRDYKFKGEGMVVGVIDTGIDFTHRDMTLTNPDSGELTEDSVTQTTQEEDLPGKFYTNKVPYGYNYMDKNDTVRENYPGASMHGMHVAGTVGANGDEDNGGVSGVAPEAQLLALKVFGNDPENQTTYGDIYIKAIDDSIKLDADVLNMSLGSPAGFVNEASAEQEAVKNAVDNGIYMSISAGNSNKLADGFYYPMASNPDYGVSGSPGLAEDSVQVASFENSRIQTDALNYTIAGGEQNEAAYLSAGNTDPKQGESYDILEAGLGKPADFEGQDFSGKYALVQRGELAFTDKAVNAQEAGAEGVIIYNNTDGIINMQTNEDIVIPQLFMLKGDGDKLAEALNNDQSVSITFGGNETSITNPDQGKMSAFTSWGLTPNLDFKPEITAPGGQIFSTLNDDEYGVMSGTSMAAPHVAGGGALVLERVDEQFGLEDADRIQRAKNLMMNTGKIVDFKGSHVSPRRQGAGLMQLAAALNTPVTVTNADTNEAKVALKEVKGDTASFELTAENFSDESVTYNVEANAQTDQPVQNGDDLIVAPNQFGSFDLSDMASATVNGQDVSEVTIPAGGTQNITVNVDLSQMSDDFTANFKNGYWLEGFVTLTDPDDTNPDLNVPYSGFKGDWDKAPIFDEPSWDDDSYYGTSGVATSVTKDEFAFLGEDINTGQIDPDKIAFSPNDDGTQDNAVMVPSFLRNAKNVTFNVLNNYKEVIRTISEEDTVRKNYYGGGTAPMFSLNGDRAWNGKIDGKITHDGQYYLQATAEVDYEGAKEQSIEIPVQVDTEAPDLETEYDPDEQLVTVDASDYKGSGVAYWDLLVDGESVLDEPYTNDETDHQLADALGDDQTLTVVAEDYAGNTAEEEAELPEPEPDTTKPELHLMAPENNSVSAEQKVDFSGYVTDESGVENVYVDDEQAELNYNKDKERYEFSLTVDHEDDGYMFHHVRAVDGAGNEKEIGRRFFIDSTPAEMDIDVDQEDDEAKAQVEVELEDNYEDIRFYINGDETYHNELKQPYELNEFEKELEDIELDLEDGKNEFEFKVVDLGGHETVENIVVEKEAEEEEEEEDEDDDDEDEDEDYSGWGDYAWGWNFR